MQQEVLCGNIIYRRKFVIVYNVHLQMNSISEKECGIEKFSGRLFSFSGKPQQSAENGGQPYLFIGGDTGTC